MLCRRQGPVYACYIARCYAVGPPSPRPATSFGQMFNIFQCYLQSIPPPFSLCSPSKPFFPNLILIIQNVPPSEVVNDAQSFPDAPDPLFSLIKENAG